MTAIDNLLEQITDEKLRERLRSEIDRMSKHKSYGLVFEEHLPECTALYDVPIRAGSLAVRRNGDMNDIYTVGSVSGDEALCQRRCDNTIETIAVSDLVSIAEFGQPIYPYLKKLDSVEHGGGDLWHALIEADNYHALQLLEYMYAGKVDCIYIDPPYNTGAKDWKYNNNYVDGSDAYRHSKWLSFMEKRLRLAKKLLNPKDSALIVTIDEKEYLRLGMLLEQVFPEARIQMVSDVINPKGVARNGFSRNDEYIFFVMNGDSVPCRLPLSDEWSSSAALFDDKSNKNVINPGWTSMMRRGSNSSRNHSPGCYYPIYVSTTEHKILEIGDPVDSKFHSSNDIDGCVQVLPIRTNGDEGCWQLSPNELRIRMSQGRIRVGRETAYGFVINYLPNGAYEELFSDDWKIDGYADDGSIIAHYISSDNKTYRIAPTQWKVMSHNASENGSTYIANILGGKRFTYPKSIYSTMDAIRFFVANKPDALIVDFFAGSGTTLHAVNLLNAEDGGHRRCIMVTNNEVSADEAKSLTEQCYQPGDPEWDKLGIARYVTWPRTVCSIEGHDVNGKPLSGNYGVQTDSYTEYEGTVVDPDTGKPVRGKLYKKTKTETMPKLAAINKADGFASNCIFFKLGFLDKDTVSLGRQFKELLPVLWMKAGAVGACPEVTDDLPDHSIFPENKFAVLIDESAYAEFITKLSEDIRVVYIVTNSDAEYRRMVSGLEGRETYQLYRDYLDNFKINRG